MYVLKYQKAGKNVNSYAYFPLKMICTMYRILSYKKTDLIKMTPRRLIIMVNEDDCLRYKNYLDSSRGFDVPVPIFFIKNKTKQ